MADTYSFGKFRTAPLTDKARPSGKLKFRDSPLTDKARPSGPPSRSPTHNSGPPSRLRTPKRKVSPADDEDEESKDSGEARVSPLYFAGHIASDEKVRAVFRDIHGSDHGLLELKELTAYLVKRGYGENEATRFFKRVDPSGRGLMSFADFHREWGFINIMEIKDHQKGDDVYRMPGSLLNNSTIMLKDCRDCTIEMCSVSAAVQVDRCEGCRIIIGPCEGSVFLRNCNNCEIAVACQQLRTRDLTACKLFVWDKTEPIIESSDQLVFAPFNTRYPQLDQQFDQLGWDPADNMWWAIYNFSQSEEDSEVSSGGPPHWREARADEWVDWCVEAPGFGEEDCVNPVPRDARGELKEDCMRGRDITAGGGGLTCDNQFGTNSSFLRKSSLQSSCGMCTIC